MLVDTLTPDDCAMDFSGECEQPIRVAARVTWKMRRAFIVIAPPFGAAHLRSECDWLRLVDPAPGAAHLRSEWDRLRLVAPTLRQAAGKAPEGTSRARERARAAAPAARRPRYPLRRGDARSRRADGVRWRYRASFRRESGPWDVESGWLRSRTPGRLADRPSAPRGRNTGDRHGPVLFPALRSPESSGHP